MSVIKCIVVTPEKTALEAEASFVVVPLFDGELGIGRDHTPLIGRLGYGELRLTQSDSVSRHYVDGGFVQVADNTVTVLTGKVVPVSDLDSRAIAQQLEEALRRPANSEELLDLREKAVTKARSQLLVARRVKRQ
jgi:F-type H+-transporting ATPase subunit epsilon